MVCRSVLLRSVAAAVLVASVSACSLWGGRAAKPVAAELGPNVAVLGVRQAWTARVGKIELPLELHVNGNVVTLASSDGVVAALDAKTGSDVWRAMLGEPLSTGPGSDGKTAAVVTRANALVALESGREKWRQQLPAQVFTPPLVAGGRVFVLSSDRSVAAYDGATGRRLWTQQRPGEPLVLRQAGVLLALGDTLVVGLSGRMVGMNPNTGVTQWELPLASPRGTNDVERLVELVGRVSRVGDSVCARAFQASVGCVNTARGAVAWTQVASGSEGIHGDDRAVFGTEGNGVVTAWSRVDGSRLWSMDRYKHRKLTAPLLLGRSIVFGDDSGTVHLVSRDDGAPLNRISTDGSGIAAAPAVASDTLVVVSRNGSVYGFRPD
ncbi:outer membrane protein assembly factor BamB [Acidovorax sp. BL-A-41-H1]|uniref:outer membrane protein assembly factor BamB n=1 Tax=Acidovorax sp. BL-A-41-H1 TaxID=3421102 RepID=UPI003F796DA1